MTSYDDFNKDRGAFLTDRTVRIGKKGNRHFRYLKWLLNAASQDPKRSVALWGFRVENQVMVACDGRRLHQCARIPGLQGEENDGNWFPELNSSTEIVLRKFNGHIVYPDFRVVIPDDDKPTRIKFDEPFKWGEEMGLALRTGSPINVDFLRDAVWGGGVLKVDPDVPVVLDAVIEPAVRVNNDGSKESGPWTIRFSDWSRFVVIMPIRIAPDLGPDPKQVMKAVVESELQKHFPGVIENKGKQDLVAPPLLAFARRLWKNSRY